MGKVECKIECKNITVESLAEYLAEIAEPGFKIWLYDKKVYAMFKVGSLRILTKFIDNLRAKEVKPIVSRIQAV